MFVAILIMFLEGYTHFPNSLGKLVVLSIQHAV